jgi:hypothetical protein
MKNKKYRISFMWLGLLFVILKITGVIDWSWWYVTMPFWSGAVFFILMSSLFMFLVLIFNKNKKL